MQGKGAGDHGRISRGKDPGTEKTGQVALSHAESHRLLVSWGVALSHAESHRLLVSWGAVEAFSVRTLWYPSASAGYRDYEPPRDPETRQEREIRRVERDWHEIHRTGWVVLGLKRWQRDALVRHYRDGNPIGGRARRAALDAFGRRWVIWSEAVDGPVNSI